MLLSGFIAHKNKKHRDFLGGCFYVCRFSGYPLKLYFQIPCVFPVRPQVFPVPIYIICAYYIYKTDLADLSSFWGISFLQQISQCPLLLKSRLFKVVSANRTESLPHLLVLFKNQSIYHLSKRKSLCFDKIPCVLIKFPNSLCFP